MTPTTDYNQYRFYFDIAQFAMTGLIGVYVWFSNRARINHKRFIDLEKSVGKKITAVQAQEMLDRQLPDCDEHQAQTRKLEETANRLGNELRAIPKRQELVQIEKSLAKIFSEVARLEGRFEGIDRLTNLLNEFMINQGGK